jgi:hypothetical protein
MFVVVYKDDGGLLNSVQQQYVIKGGSSNEVLDVGNI